MSAVEDGAKSEASNKAGTELIHLTYDGNFQLECTTTVIDCRVIDKGEESERNQQLPHEKNVEIRLDATTMHPQGGGQPSDHGIISLATSKDDVSDDCTSSPICADIQRVTVDRETGVVTHSGKVAIKKTFDETNTTSDQPALSPPFPVGAKVHVSVDPERRKILSECHTAGHVVDAAMARCDQIMPPTKGYHFLDGPYVEYRGAIPPKERPEVLERLKAAFQDLVNEDIKTTIETLPRANAEEECNRLAQNFDLSEYDAQVRVVHVAGWACPCGGTHVRSTLDLKERAWGITGLKCKKDVVRVKYNQGAA